MDIQVLISTTNPDPKDFYNLNFDKLIISQNDRGIVEENELIKFLSFDEKGLSKSRNRAIQESSADIGLIADDDLIYFEDFEAKIKNAFEKFPDADILTFKITTPDGKPYKKYSDSPFKHSRTSIYKVSSVEMVLKLSSIKSAGVAFDERFGLGATYSSGEETIFLNDALDAGLNLYFFPEPIVIHPIESSGKILDENFFYSKGALIRRLYSGTLNIIIGIIFLIKQITKKQNTLTLTASLKSIIKGLRSL
ncbi:glycosyltransferase family A protein [Algoriphagus sp. SE2]|uniref:glycosyltransferase family 2 protein n=1 Tax=Algoriphagus sp. SE2 TaxID=3141536 RepID=UPI0031CD9F90